MMRYKVHQETPQPRAIVKAVEAVQSEHLIIYPTDTVYGIGCNLFNKKTLEKLYRLKGTEK
ncbi:MAG: Sua5/YciO/YrdC/YwlC family protein, partial [Calditrichia bacterium]